MGNTSTLTDLLRKDLISEYEILKDVFYLDNQITDDSNDSDEVDDLNDEVDYVFSLSDEEIENYLDDEEIDLMIDNFFNKEINSFVEEIYNNLENYIKASKYKNIIYLILLNDAFECIKSKIINGIVTLDFEYEIIEKLEDYSIKELINKLNESNTFLFDLLTLFFEYNNSATKMDRRNNRKMIKMTKDRENFKKFKIYYLDDIYYEYIREKNK